MAGKTVQNGKNVQTVLTDQEDAKDINETVVPAKVDKKKIVEDVEVAIDVFQKDKVCVGSKGVVEVKDYQAKGIVPCKDLQEAFNIVLDIEDDEAEDFEDQKIFMYQVIYVEASDLVQKSKQKDLFSIHIY